MARKNEIALVERHLRLIAQICWKHWNGIPLHERTVLSIDDLVSETVVAVAEKIARKGYDRKRGAETTFVYWVAQSHCRNAINRFNQRKRNGVTTSMSAPVAHGRKNDSSNKITVEDVVANVLFRRGDRNEVRWSEARDGFEHVLQCASEGLQSSLALFLSKRRMDAFSNGDLEELRTLTRQHRVSRDDFAKALSVA